MGYDQIVERLQSIGHLDLHPDDARIVIEDMLDQGHSAERVYDALFSACWAVLTGVSPADPTIPSWRNLFLKATVLFRAIGKDELAQKTFTLSDMMAISMRKARGL
ncbi:hypothetical protein OIU34_17765 [Pararhizobium sp. BT-229]|uniref:hypothetical protein n=1 Tax=Pararhizobium sp. BT-229 TaxID=2986923 RepID=UPI0021F74B71|nr:hypothetical protein [Pararhizobium sp. BT-229]MCV9963726.1 hypothetical protein [Pararhizobium sp. BT-229]